MFRVGRVEPEYADRQTQKRKQDADAGQNAGHRFGAARVPMPPEPAFGVADRVQINHPARLAHDLDRILAQRSLQTMDDASNNGIGLILTSRERF